MIFKNNLTKLGKRDYHKIKRLFDRDCLIIKIYVYKKNWN